MCVPKAPSPPKLFRICTGVFGDTSSRAIRATPLFLRCIGRDGYAYAEQHGTRTRFSLKQDETAIVLPVQTCGHH